MFDFFKNLFRKEEVEESPKMKVFIFNDCKDIDELCERFAEILAYRKSNKPMYVDMEEFFIASSKMSREIQIIKSKLAEINGTGSEA